MSEVAVLVAGCAHRGALVVVTLHGANVAIPLDVRAKGALRTHRNDRADLGMVGRIRSAAIQRSGLFPRAASSVAASMSLKVEVSILSISGPVNRPSGPPLGTYR